MAPFHLLDGFFKTVGRCDRGRVLVIRSFTFTAFLSFRVAGSR